MSWPPRGLEKDMSSERGGARSPLEGVQFHRRLQLAAGVWLNVSKSGLSLTVRGFPGLSVNLGKRGVFLNTSLPGSGVRKRFKLADLLSALKAVSEARRSRA